jgi:hypothetical protein
MLFFIFVRSTSIRSRHGRDTLVRDASSKGRIGQGTHRPRDASSKRLIVQGTYHPRDASFKGHIVQGTHRPRDTLSKGLIIQGTRLLRDTLYKGRIVQGTHCQRYRTSETFYSGTFGSGTLHHVILAAAGYGLVSGTFCPDMTLFHVWKGCCPV